MIRTKTTKTKLIETKGNDRDGMSTLCSIKEMDILLYSPSLPPTAWVSCTKNSAQKNQRKTRRNRAGKFISCTMGSGKKLIKEEAEKACARPHSGIRLSVIDEVDAEVDNDSMKEDDDNKRNKTDNETANGDKEMSIGR